MTGNRRKLVLSLAILFILNILIFLLMHSAVPAEAAIYRRGPSDDIFSDPTKRSLASFSHSI